jgi:hypothetical protein
MMKTALSFLFFSTLTSVYSTCLAITDCLSRNEAYRVSTVCLSTSPCFCFKKSADGRCYSSAVSVAECKTANAIEDYEALTAEAGICSSKFVDDPLLNSASGFAEVTNIQELWLKQGVADVTLIGQGPESVDEDFNSTTRDTDSATEAAKESGEGSVKTSIVLIFVAVAVFFSF